MSRYFCSCTRYACISTVQASLGAAMQCVIMLLIAWVSAPHVSAQQDPGGESKTLPLTVVGEAVDEEGRAVSGATIYLVATGLSPSQVLGQCVTAADGRYEFVNVSVPKSRQKSTNGFTVGYFQVFGKAPSRSIAWQGLRLCYIAPPDARDADGNWYRKRGFAAGGRAELNLTFARRTQLHGRFVDENGKAVPRVGLKLIFCDSIAPYPSLSEKEWRSFFAIHQAAELMPDELTAMTRDDGTFSFESLAPEALCEIIISHAEYAPRRFFASAASNPPKLAYDGRAVLKSPIEIVLRSVRTVLVSVKDESGVPIPGVRVAGRRSNLDGTHYVGRSDNNGAVTLKLPPGDYTLECMPPRGVNFITTSRSLTVEESPDTQSTTVQLDAGCTVILKAIDAEKGTGVSGVRFWCEITQRRAGRAGVIRTRLQSMPSMGDDPSTDADGVLRAVVEPGRTRIGLGAMPEGYEVTNLDDSVLGRVLQSPRGGVTTAEFALRKTGK